MDASSLSFSQENKIIFIHVWAPCLFLFFLLKLKAEKAETTGASGGTEWYYRLAANFSDHLSNIF